VPGTHVTPNAPVRKQGTGLGDQRIVVTPREVTRSDRLPAVSMMEVRSSGVRSMQPITYIKNAWSYTSTAPRVFVVCTRAALPLPAGLI